MNQGMQKKSRLWSVAGQKAFRQLPLMGWRSAGVRTYCSCWSTWISRLHRWIEPRNSGRADPSTVAVDAAGVGPITALAFVLTITNVTRFARGKQWPAVELIPREHIEVDDSGCVSKRQ